MLTALLFGLAPAVQTARRDIVEPLKDSGKGVSGGFRHGKLRGALVVIEVALSLVLLTGAGLLMRSFMSLQQVDLGFAPGNLLFSRLPFPKGQYKTAAAKQHFFSQLLPRLQRIPSVLAAATVTVPPPFGGINSDIEIPGKTHTEKWKIHLPVGQRHALPHPQAPPSARADAFRIRDPGRAQSGRRQSDAGEPLLRQR